MDLSLASHLWFAKTDTLLISNKNTLHNRPHLYLGDPLITYVNEQTHSGLILYHDLKWKARINEVVSECSKQVNITMIFKDTLDRQLWAICL